MTSYRNVKVRSDFRLTSTSPGGGTSVAVSSGHTKPHSAICPQIRNPKIEARISLHLHVSSSQATQLFLDAQKFLWMAAQSSEPCFPAPLIDDAWHEFLMYTREYADFCEKFCGGFMHHEPHHGIVAEEVDVLILQPTIDLMYSVFGNKPNSNWDYVPSIEAIAA